MNDHLQWAIDTVNAEPEEWMVPKQAREREQVVKSAIELVNAPPSEIEQDAMLKRHPSYKFLDSAARMAASYGAHAGSTDYWLRRIGDNEKPIFMAVLAKRLQAKDRRPTEKLYEAYNRGVSKMEASYGRTLDVLAGGKAADQAAFIQQVEGIVRGADPLKGRTWVGSGVYGAAEMAPQMITGSLAGPLAVPFWMVQTIPDAYADFRGQGIDDSIARPAALITALPEALIERLQVKQLLPKPLRDRAKGVVSQSVGAILKRLLARMGKTYATEMGEEALQAATRTSVKALAAWLDKNAPGIDWEQELGGFAEEMKQAAISMPFLLAPGAGIELAADAFTPQAMVAGGGGAQEVFEYASPIRGDQEVFAAEGQKPEGVEAERGPDIQREAQAGEQAGQPGVPQAEAVATESETEDAAGLTMVEQEAPEQPSAPALSYDDFEKQYREAFDRSNKYTPDQAGSKIYTDKMAELSDAYPEYAERLDAELDAEYEAAQKAKKVSSAQPAKQPWEMTREEAASDPRFRIGGDMGETVARVETDGKVALSDAFFDHDSAQRKRILEHEFAHKEVDPSEERFWRLVDSGALGTFDENTMTWKGVAPGRNPEETLTQLIANYRGGGDMPPEVLAEYPDLAAKYGEKAGVKPKAETKPAPVQEPAPSTAKRRPTGKQYPHALTGTDMRNVIRQVRTNGLEAMPADGEDAIVIGKGKWPAAGQKFDAVYTVGVKTRGDARQWVHARTAEEAYAYLDDIVAEHAKAHPNAEYGITDELVDEQSSSGTTTPKKPKAKPKAETKPAPVQEPAPPKKTKAAKKPQPKAVTTTTEPLTLSFEGPSGARRTITVQSLKYDQLPDEAKGYVDRQYESIHDSNRLTYPPDKAAQQEEREWLAIKDGKKPVTLEINQAEGREPTYSIQNDTPEKVYSRWTKRGDLYDVQENEAGRKATEAQRKADEEHAAREEQERTAQYDLERKEAASRAVRVKEFDETLGKEKFKRATISIPLGDGSKEQQQGLQYKHMFVGTETTFKRKVYIVTHVPTGMKAAQYDSAKEARIAAVRLAELIGTESDVSVVQKAPEETKKKIRAILKDAYAELATPAPSASAAAEADAARQVEQRGAGFVPPQGRQPARGPDVLGGQAERGPLEFRDPEVQRRYQQAHGVRPPNWMQKAGDLAVAAWHRATRHFVHLPKGPRFASAANVLRELQEVPQSMSDEAQRRIATVLDTLAGPQQRQLFEQKIFLENALRAVENDQPLRFGFQSRAQIEGELMRVDDLIKNTPEVQKAVERRQAIAQEIVDKAMELNLLPEGTEAAGYMHQQVMMYMELDRKYGSGTKKLGKTKRPFQKKRVRGVESMGEEYDYNTSYLESEYAWTLDALIETRKEELLRKMMGVEDIMDTVRAEAAEAKEDNWRSMIPDGYTIWQPEPGTAFYKAFSIPAKIMEVFESGMFESLEITKDQVREVLAMGQAHRQFVIPTELAAQLSEKTPTRGGPIDWAAQALGRMWKQWTLLNPKRALAYNLRNWTGDLDPMVAGAPGALKYAAEKNSTQELWRYFNGYLSLTPTLRAARDAGVISASMTAQEIPQLRELGQFKRLYGGQSRLQPINLVARYFETVKKHSEFRESILRYAAFRYAFDIFEAGKDLPHYGASRKADIDQVRKDLGNGAAAAKYSRELLGDYGAITAMGNWLRSRLVLFWSFQEINLRRYPMMMANALQAGNVKQMGGAAAMMLYRGITLSRIAWGYGLMWLWNNLIFPDEEEEHGPWIRSNPHINLGKGDDGHNRVFWNSGALGDFMEWFGFNNLLSLYPQYASGQLDGKTLVTEMMKDPVNKFVQGLAPHLKNTAEVVSGLGFFPDAFNPRAIDRWEAAWGTLGLQDEAKGLRGLITKNGMRMRPNWTERIGWGVVDPRQEAMHEIHELRRRFQEKKGRDMTGIYPRSKISTMRTAAMQGNYEAFKEAWRIYVADGNTYQKNFLPSLKRIDPVKQHLGPALEKEFINDYLNALQRKKLAIAQDYSMEIHLLMHTWWKRAIAEEGVPTK